MKILSFRIHGVVLVWLLVHLSAVLAAQAKQDVEQAFRGACDRWKAHVDAELSESSGPGLYTCKEYQAIVKLGLPAVPFMIDIMAGRKDEWRSHLKPAVATITKRRFHERLSLEAIRKGGFRRRWAEWWANAEEQTPKDFVRLLVEWRRLKAANRADKAAEVYEQIQDLGVLALPLVVAEIQKGETNFIPIMSKLTDGEVPLDATSAQCAKWLKNNEVKGQDRQAALASPTAGETNAPRRIGWCLSLAAGLVLLVVAIDCFRRFRRRRD